MISILSVGISQAEAYDRKITTPKSCSKCNSPYWDKKLERKSVSENRKEKMRSV